MSGLLTLFAAHPVLLLFAVVGIGSAIGHITIRGIGLGAAAVLFLALLIGAVGAAQGIEVTVPAVLGTLGLTLFTFTVGIVSGPEFFASLRRSLGLVGVTVGVLCLGAATAVGVGRMLALDSATVAGAFAGAVTNTPALAAARDAAGDQAAPTVGYAVTYVFGVVGMLVIAMLVLRKAGSDTDTPPELVSRNVRIEVSTGQSVRELTELYGSQIAFSRLRHASETAPPVTIEEDDVPVTGDTVTIVGPEALVDEVTHALGHTSSHKLDQDGRYLAMRRMTVSSRAVAGLTIRELDLMERFGGTVTRLRRGDVDAVATPESVVRLGDRMRVVAPRGRMDEVTRFLGDSARGFFDINPIVLGVGMALGVALGLVVLPVPGHHVTIGAAAGTLIVGLIMGRVGRIGPVVTTVPFTAAQSMSELGLLVFLAQAGLVAGTQIGPAFASGEWVRIALVGVCVTSVVGVGLWIALRRAFRVGATTASGMIAGTQTQPAVLALANHRTGFDPRVALGYALVYPAAMITKVILGGLLGSL